MVLDSVSRLVSGRDYLAICKREHSHGTERPKRNALFLRSLNTWSDIAVKKKERKV